MMPLLRKPEQVALEPSAALVLQAASTGTDGLQQNPYELPVNQKVVIGRDDSQCQICLPNQYAWVSGCHAEIQSVLNSEADRTRPIWEICDLNSRNGTYINGQRLEKCQALQIGDRITLGSEEPTEKSPELIFECQSGDADVSPENDTFYRELVDCDVLCLIADSNSMLGTDEKQLIEKASKSSITLLVVVVELPEPQSKLAQEIKTSMAEVKTWLQGQNSGLSFELAPLPLRPFYPDAQDTEVDSSQQKELDRLCKVLETLVRRKPEDILTKRLTAQVLSQLALLEGFLNKQEEALERESQQDETKLRGVKGDDLQKQTEKALKQLNDERVEFFKQTKAKLNQSKASLIDEYITESIISKISEAVEGLKPHVTKQEGSKFIELKATVTKSVTQRRGSKNSKPKEKTIDANTAIIDLCRTELSQWASEEWERICTFYAQGGLKGVFQKTYRTLNAIPSLNLSNFSWQPNPTIDIQEVFPTSIKKPPCETRYQAVSPVFFILKRIRSQWMQFMFLFSFLSVLGIAGGRRQVIQKITQPIHGVFESAPLIALMVLAVLGYFLFKYLKRAYQSFKQAEQEKAVEKMRNELRSYYQSFVKNRLVERISQRLMLALEAEEQRIEEILQTIKQLVEQAVTETESGQLPIKLRMNKRKEQQTNLKKDMSELQKLKRI
jgi:pSer/pThr/pTyr-binding forkhead associated (FHA) protein